MTDTQNANVDKTHEQYASDAKYIPQKEMRTESRGWDWVREFMIRIYNPWGEDVIMAHKFESNPSQRLLNEGHLDFEADMIYQSTVYLTPGESPLDKDDLIWKTENEIPADVQKSAKDTKETLCKDALTDDPEQELAIIYKNAPEQKQEQLGLPERIISLA